MNDLTDVRIFLASLLRPIINEAVKESLQVGGQKAIIQSEPDRWFDLSELCDYLPDKPRKGTVYEWVSLGLIPYHKGTKKLRFLKSEIDGWLKKGRSKTFAETASEAETYLKNKKKKGVKNG